MGLVLDSTVLISAERKKLDLSRLLLDQSVTETVVISVITASELLHGCERAENAKVFLCIGRPSRYSTSLYIVAMRRNY